MVLLFHNRLSSAAAGAIAIAVVTAQPITPPFAAAQSAALAFAIATSRAAADGARAAIRDPRLLVLVLYFPLLLRVGLKYTGKLHRLKCILTILE